MATSAKDIYESNIHAADVYAAGVWRGTGPADVDKGPHQLLAGRIDTAGPVSGRIDHAGLTAGRIDHASVQIGKATPWAATT